MTGLREGCGGGDRLCRGRGSGGVKQLDRG